MRVVLLLLALALPARAADPDTFDPAKRDPAWLAKGVREARDARHAMAARATDAWIEKCAVYLRETRPPDSVEEEAKRQAEPYEAIQRRALTTSGLGEDDARICGEFQRQYVFSRWDLLSDVVADALGSGARDGEAEYRGKELDEFQRQFGSELVERLERHRKALLSAPGYTGEIEWAILEFPSPPFDPAQSAEERVRGEVRAAIAQVATDATLDRYVRLEAARAAARAFQPGGVKEEPAKDEARISGAGLTSGQLKILDAVLERTRDGRSPREWWERFRSTAGDEIATFLEQRTSTFDQRLMDARTDAVYAKWHPRPLPPRIDRGPLLRVGVKGGDTTGLSRVRVDDAGGHAVLDCPEVSEGAEAPCLIGPAALANPGKYKAIASFASGAKEAAFTVEGSESRVEVTLDPATSTVEVTRVLPGPAGAKVVLDGSPSAERIGWKLVNEGTVPLAPGAATWGAAVRLEYDGGLDWEVSSADADVSRSDAAPLAPGESITFEFGARGPVYNSEPTFRLAVRLAASPGTRVEATTPAARFPVPSRRAAPNSPCVAEPLTFSPTPSVGFGDLVRTPSGLLAIHAPGIVRLEGTTLVPVSASTDDLGAFSSSADASIVATHGWHTVVVSRDGGRSFAPVDTGMRDVGAVAVSGTDVLVFARDGSALRLGADGTKSPIELPKKASWWSARFDGPHGYLNGACDSHFETRDGGRTWTIAGEEKPTPLQRGHDRIFAGRDGLQVSHDDGATFTTELPGPCSGLHQSGSRILAICRTDGDHHTALFVSDGGPFRPVPSELPLEVRAAELDANGGILAVGSGDVLLTGTVEGVQQRLETEDAKRSVLAAMRRSFPAGKPPSAVRAEEQRWLEMKKKMQELRKQREELRGRARE